MKIPVSQVPASRKNRDDFLDISGFPHPSLGEPSGSQGQSKSNCNILTPQKNKN